MSRVARYCSNVVGRAGESIGASGGGGERRPRPEKLIGGSEKSVEIWVKFDESLRGEC